ncbi:MAG TPA: hypothetical protein GX513_14375 [Firmicutes bacterium]|nr:hypothetical protein [Bacillota bacterium]
MLGHDVELVLEGDRTTGTLEVKGRWGGETLGFDCDLEYDVATGQLRGRLGGEVVGHTVDIQAAPEVSPLVAAFIACCTYHSYLQTQPRSSGGGAASTSN